LQDGLPITAATTAPQLHDDLAAMGGRLIVETLARLDDLQPLPQPEEGATYAHMLSRDDGRIDWRAPAAQTERQLRALTPWPGVWCVLPGGGRLKVLAASVAAGDGAPGTILDPHLTVACGDGRALRLDRVQPENKKPMGGRDAVNGGIVQPGDILQ
jgi:methionyl-tRNA formyltransferase